MTKEEMAQIAAMVAEVITQNGSQKAPESPTIVSNPKDDPTVVNVVSSEQSEAETQVEVKHKPAISAEQIVEIINDGRFEVRVQFKQPWVRAMEELFKHPVAVATIDGRKQPLINADQVNRMISALKESGKYWPQIVCTVLNENGDKVYVNSSYKRQSGEKWKLGNIVRHEAEEVLND